MPRARKSDARTSDVGAALLMPAAHPAERLAAAFAGRSHCNVELKPGRISQEHRRDVRLGRAIQVNNRGVARRGRGRIVAA